ncbi:MAG: GNAT family N-acetyltransferase [Gammaproteobacteria bacterium]
MSTKPGANIEIRPATKDEMPGLNRNLAYAFADNSIPSDESPPGPLQAEQTLCAFDGEKMVATSGAYDFKMRFNGRAVAADGVTVVSCDPGYRRRGIVRQLIDGLLQRSRERDVPIAILWASMGAIYQRFGYGLATTQVGYDVPVPYVQFQYGERPPGQVRLMDQADALPLLNAVYRQYSDPASGMLHRSEVYWEVMLRRQNDQHTHTAVYFEESDAPRGYCLYRTKWRDTGSQGPNHLVDVFDFIWLDIEAYRGLWHYLAGHDLADRIRIIYVAEDDPAPNMFLEPRMLGRRTWDGVWLRVVDVEAALSARGYDVPGEAIVEVHDDDLCPWNNGRYRLVADGETGTVERISNSVSADILTRPDAFASLVSGHTRVSDLARMGRLRLADPRRGAELDALFATRRRPHCPNMF